MSRILFVNKGKLGGPSHSLLKLLTYLRHLHDIQVLLSDPGELKTALHDQGIPYASFPVRYRSIPKLYAMLKCDRVDLVYANSFTATAWRVLIAAKLARVPFIWHIREILSTDTNPYRVIRRVRYADQVIAVSEACRQSVLAITPHTPTTVVYNGVGLGDFQYKREEARQYTLEQLGRDDDDVIIVSVGTINARKNQADAIRAVHSVIQGNPRVHLYMFGESDPTYLPGVMHLIDELKLGENVHFMEFRRDISHILCGADIGVHTARVDPHPRAVLEVLAASMPVVGYDVDGVGETLNHGDNGYLVPVGSVDRLAHYLQQAVDDQALRTRLGMQARTTIQNRFSANQTAEKVHQIIEQVLMGHTVSSDP